MISYYVTCLMSGVVELGSVFWGIHCGFSFVHVLGLALAYQMGNILRFFITPNIARYQNLFVGSVLSISVSFLVISPESVIGYVLAIVMFMGFSTMLQNIRSAVQGKVPRWQKRSCRVVGFVMSAVVYIWNIQVMIVLSIMLLFFSIKHAKFSYDKWLFKWKRGEYGEKVCWAMVTHQAHYFAYNYIMLVIVMEYFHNPLITTAWFAGNWIPYTITEPLVHKLKWKAWYKVAVGAHVFNAIVLLGMFLFVRNNMYIAVCLWVLTGFGGGNVFCIKKTLAEKVVYDKNVWSFSEQIGHILGVISGMLLVGIGIPEEYSMLVGMVYALFTIPMIVFVMRRD